MYKIQIQGCLPFLIIFIFLFIVLKLWIVLVLFIFAALIYSFVSQLIYRIALKKKEMEQNYTPNKGEVYKICPFCGINVKRTAKTCPQCGHSLE